MSFFKNERNWVLIILTILSVAFITVVFFTQSSFGGGDHYEHYKLAHFGWKYPKMLFNHWGKPVFTILISPFAQFGINSARIYNVLAGLLTAFLTWKLAIQFKFKYAWLTVVFVVFTPIYFATMFAVLTEITFSLFLVFSILLFFRQRYILSAIILSFLPLVRTEGIVLFPLFILAYSLKKQFKALPFLSVGFLLISALGSPFYDNFWWLITEMPYSGDAKSIYGSGSLWHFVNHTPNITGGPIAALFVVGLISLLIKWVRNREIIFNDWFYFILLIPGSFLTFFAAHSYVWWQGMGNSLGLTRVIASVSPLAALTAVFGLQFLLEINFRYRKILAAIFISVLVFWVPIDGVNKHRYGFYYGSAEVLLNKVASFIQKNNLDKHKIFYFNSYIIFPLGIDPNNNLQGQWNIQNRQNPSWEMPDSSILIWDAHFGPNEGGVPIERLENQDGLIPLAVFKPDVPFKVLGGYDYEIIVFQKNNSLKKDLIRNILQDFESDQFSETQKTFTGAKSFQFLEHIEYCSFCKVNYSDISRKLLPLQIEVSFSIIIEKKLKEGELFLVCSLEQDDKMIEYKAEDLSQMNIETGKWRTIEESFELAKPKESTSVIKVYLWNNKSFSGYVDDVNISFEINE